MHSLYVGSPEKIDKKNCNWVSVKNHAEKIFAQMFPVQSSESTPKRPLKYMWHNHSKGSQINEVLIANGYE